MNVPHKKVLSALLAIALVFSLCSCGKQPIADEPKPPVSVEPTSEPSATAEPSGSSEPTNDPFLVEDDIVDSTNEIVIDLHAFIETQNALHKAVVETEYPEEWYQTYGPDFHDTLDLVSKEEAETLLTTKRRDGSATCTKEDALKDVDLLFRLYKSLYGPYEYFGGDAAFGAAQNAVIEEINAFTGTLTINDLATILIENLSFIKDRHTSINNRYLTDYHKLEVKDHYVKDLFFYEDDIGYYTKKYDRKWYLTQVGSDQNVSEYLKLTIDEKGQLCYMLGLSVTEADTRLKNRNIVLVRGTQEVSQSIKWTKFRERKWEADQELVTVSGNNIPFLEIDQTSEEYDAQNERIRQMGPDLLSQDVFILDANTGSGWQSLFASIRHSKSAIYLYKLSNVADYIGLWNMPWDAGNTFGEYHNRVYLGRWGENDTLVFAVQDVLCYSAQESTIADIRAIENVITVGGSTGGTAGPGGSTNSHLHLPNTGLHVQLGASLSITAGYTEEGYCIEPDIWVNPTDAVDAVYRLCEFYGIENTADTSVLDKYK